MLPLTIDRARQLGISLALPALPVRTLGTVLVYLLFGSFALLQFTDPDFWWHLRTGELIVDTGSIPKTDPFSFTAAGSDWIAHEWLSDLLIYAVEDSVGYWGNVILFTAVALAALAVMHRLLVRIGVSPRVILPLLILGGITSIPYWTVRPQAFSWLFTAMFVYTLWLRRLDGKTGLWHLPLLMVFWANLHAGYVIGLVLMGLWLLVLLGERLLWHRGQDLRPPVLATVACLAVTAVNPNGLALVTYPFTYLVPGNASQSFVGEWQSPDFHLPFHWPLLLGIVALVVVGVRGQGRDLFRLALAVVFTVMALQASRHQPLAALIFIPVLGDAVRERWAWARAGEAATPPVRGLPVLNWSILAVAVVALTLFLGRSSQLQLNSSPQTTGIFDYPVDGADFIRDNYPEARIFNLYGWGGYLINELYPEQHVFIDGRADMYGDALMEEYTRVERLEPGWRDVLTKYDVDLVIIEADSPLAAVLLEAADWRLAFSGPIESVFVREPAREASPAAHGEPTFR